MLRPSAMLTLDDLQKWIFAALGILIVSWSGYITAKVLDSATNEDIDKMIENANKSGYYAQDRASIQKSIQDLFAIVNKISADQDRLKDGLSVNNDKIIANNQQVWNELSLLKIEIEKMKLKLDYNDEKKNGIGEATPMAPSSSQPVSYGWRTF